MRPSRDEVLAHFIAVLRSIDQDEEVDEIAEDTHLIGDTNWRSIEIAFIASEIQQHYGRPFPFEELFERVSKREVQDITVGEWVDFVWEHLGTPPPAEQPAT